MSSATSLRITQRWGPWFSADWISFPFCFIFLCSNIDKHVLKMEGSIVSFFRYGCPYCEMFKFFVKFWSVATEKAQGGGNAPIRLFSLTIKTHIFPFYRLATYDVEKSIQPVACYSVFFLQSKTLENLKNIISFINEYFFHLILVFTFAVFKIQFRLLYFNDVPLERSQLPVSLC
jgi:hypothetical protein